MDKNGMILVSTCCNATVEKEEYENTDGWLKPDYKCNTCGKVCEAIKRISSNAKEGDMKLQFGDHRSIELSQFCEEWKAVQVIYKKLCPKYHWDKKVRCKACTAPLYKLRGWDLKNGILVWNYCQNFECRLTKKLQTSNLAGTCCKVLEHTWEVEHLLSRYEEMMPKLEEYLKEHPE